MSDPENAVFDFRGMLCVVGCRRKYRAYAAAYGVTSNTSDVLTPEETCVTTFLTVLPQASRVVKPASPITRISSGVSSRRT